MTRGYRSSRPFRCISLTTRQCRFCSYSASSKGIASHERSCLQKQLDKIRSDAIQKARDIENELAVLTECVTPLNAESNPKEAAIPWVQDIDSEGPPSESLDHLDILADIDTPTSTSVYPEDRVTRQPEVTGDISRAEEVYDSIKVEYHPSSEQQEEILSFREYRHRDDDLPPPVDAEPWLPFKTRGDFEYANISLAAGLNSEQNENLIKLINRIAEGRCQFTLTSNRHLQNTWEEASIKLPAFEKTQITVKYKEENRTFVLYKRCLWKWALEILKDPRLVKRFNWDARRLYKFNHSTKEFVRYYDEPWTGDHFWDIQSNIPEGGKPFGIIFYADKNKLSTFGTEKGYPVIVRCANLPDDIRNSDGIGGGIMVGWLPVVPENARDSNKTSFANFKNEVWHRAVSEILESIKSLSSIGCWVECGDGIERQVFPCVVIASADFEEKAVISLTRGVKSLKPCPTCEVPFTQLCDLSKTYRERTGKGTKMQYELGRLTRTKKAQEERFKSLGLRPVYNAFWDVKNSDIHKALSFDRLHTFHSGLFAGHIWKLFKMILKKMNRRYSAAIDKGFQLFPIWRDIYHFDSVIHITFNDGKKHEDLSKQLLYVAQSVIDRDEDSKLYVLLRLLRSFLVLDTYVSFDRHTSATIAAGQKELKTFHLLLKKYMSIDTGPDAKNWNFPKLHELLHAFNDILRKGVSRNYNTKPNEKMHGPLRDIYHERTNYRNVAPQITKIDHHFLVSRHIKAQIDVLDELAKNNLDDDTAFEGENSENRFEDSSSFMKLPPDEKYYMGAWQKPTSLSQLEAMYKDDVGFKDFRKKLAQFLNVFFPAFNIPLPHNKYLKLDGTHTIVEYRYLKVHYESKVTWRVHTDYLRCSPKFYGRPRYDSVLVKTVKGLIFARLAFLFVIWIDSKPYPFALVQAQDAYLGPPRNKDKELGILRRGIKPRSETEFIPVSTIERGALIMQEFAVGKENEQVVVDTVDGDMFLRVQEMQMNV